MLNDGIFSKNELLDHHEKIKSDLYDIKTCKELIENGFKKNSYLSKLREFKIICQSLSFLNEEKADIFLYFELQDYISDNNYLHSTDINRILEIMKICLGKDNIQIESKNLITKTINQFLPLFNDFLLKKINKFDSVDEFFENQCLINFLTQHGSDFQTVLIEYLVIFKKLMTKAIENEHNLIKVQKLMEYIQRVEIKNLVRTQNVLFQHKYIENDEFTTIKELIDQCENKKQQFFDELSQKMMNKIDEFHVYIMSNMIEIISSEKKLKISYENWIEEELKDFRMNKNFIETLYVQVKEKISKDKDQIIKHFNTIKKINKNLNVKIELERIIEDELDIVKNILKPI